MSKALMIYYSLEGNTEFAAQTIAQYADIELERLIPKSEPPKEGFGKFFWGGKSVVFSETPVLRPLEHDPDGYDTVIIGYPIWAGTYPPAIASFIKDHPLTGKNCFIIACSGGGNAKKSFDKLAQKLPGCTIKGTLSLIDPLKDKQGSAESIRKFAGQL